jgi:hypothetical protein
LQNFGSSGQRWEFQKILEIKFPYLEIIRNFNPCPKGSAQCARNLSARKGQCDQSPVLSRVHGPLTPLSRPSWV